MIRNGNRTTIGTEGCFSGVCEAIGANGANTYHIVRVRQQVSDSIVVTENFYAIFGDIYHIMIGCIGIGNGDISRRIIDIGNNHLRRFHAGRQLINCHIVKIGGTIVVRTESYTASGNACESHLKMVPATACRQTCGDGSKSGFISNISNNTCFKTMSVSRKDIELKAQLVGCVFKRR